MRTVWGGNIQIADNEITLSGIYFLPGVAGAKGRMGGGGGHTLGDFALIRDPRTRPEH